MTLTGFAETAVERQPELEVVRSLRSHFDDTEEAFADSGHAHIDVTHSQLLVQSVQAKHQRHEELVRSVLTWQRCQ